MLNVGRELCRVLEIFEMQNIHVSVDVFFDRNGTNGSHFAYRLWIPGRFKDQNTNTMRWICPRSFDGWRHPRYM